MYPKNSTFVQKFRHPIIYGSLFLSTYLIFTNRHKLMGDLEAQRDVLFVEDKEARILLERAKREAQKS